MPCPHHDIKIVQRSNRQSAVAAAAYQSGERLFSEYDQKQKYYSEKRGIVHTEIMLPPHAPPEYADRNTLWNAAETQEKQWNSQLARRIVLAIPREIPRSQHADLIRDYCREFFVSKGMIADFAIHDKGDGNPHAHILLTMRAMDETGKWLPKSRKVYDLDENDERIRLPSGNWKSHKEDTVDWNDQKYAEIWRQGWAAIANRYLEANDRPERLDLRSYERQGLDKIPTVHMGPAVSQMEKRGIQTNIGNLNRDITAANRLMQSIRQMVRHLKGWIADLKEKKAVLLEALQEAKEPTLPELLGKYLDLRREERISWTSKGQLKGTVNDFNKVMDAIRYLREKELSTVESLDTYLDTVSGQAVSIRAEMKPKEKRMKEIDTMLSHIANFEAHKAVHTEYAAIRFKKPKEQFAAAHRGELDAYNAAVRYFKVHLEGTKYSTKKLNEERTQLAGEVAEYRECLSAVQEDVKILRDVRHWLNQVLPSEQYRQTAEPGKKPSIQQAVKGRAQRIPFQKDEFNPVRAEYSQMLKKQLSQGNNGLTKTKYLTFGIEAESMRQAKPRLAHIENDLLNNFRRLGVVATPMDGKERLRLMHAMFHMGDDDKFFFDWKWLVESGLSVGALILYILGCCIYCVFQSLWLQLGLLVGIGLAVYAVLFLFVLFQEIGEHIKENLRDFIFS